MSPPERLIHDYYAAFDAGDTAAMLALLAEDVVHDINQGPRARGRAEFAAFMARMNRCYRERLSDIVVLTEPSGTRAAAEFVVHGTYLAADDKMPAAQGQAYMLPAGAFFEIAGGRITRVSNFYNLPDWIAQVSA